MFSKSFKLEEATTSSFDRPNSLLERSNVTLYPTDEKLIDIVCTNVKEYVENGIRDNIAKHIELKFETILKMSAKEGSTIPEVRDIFNKKTEALKNRILHTQVIPVAEINEHTTDHTDTHMLADTDQATMLQYIEEYAAAISDKILEERLEYKIIGDPLSEKIMKSLKELLKTPCNGKDVSWKTTMVNKAEKIFTDLKDEVNNSDLYEDKNLYLGLIKNIYDLRIEGFKQRIYAKYDSAKGIHQPKVPLSSQKIKKPTTPKSIDDMTPAEYLRHLKAKQ